ncbi:MAG: ATP-binding protein [Dehalococcoidia bacterium]
MTTETMPVITRLEAPEDEGPMSPFVSQANTIEETGLDLSLLVDMAVKSTYFTGRPTGRQLAAHLALAYSVVEELIAFLRQAQALEIVGSSGMGEQGYQYALTARGVQKAEEALERNQYVGPAPVPFDQYVKIVKEQAVSTIEIDRDKFLDGLSHLVLSRRVLAALGPAINSARSLMVYGGAGNGKSTITTAVGKMLPGLVLIPHAVEVHGQIIKVFDPRLHQQELDDIADDDRRQSILSSQSESRERRRDKRWVVCRRPLVTIGGELVLEDLELRYSPVSKFYVAPLQWKANCGVLVVDDFGRQRIAPQDLLNRWIVPMEQGVDHLSLHSGDTLELPFEVLLIFSTNIAPAMLGDEAFFRRIRHKVEIPNPDEDEFLQILRRVCDQKHVQYADEGARYLIETFYYGQSRDFKGCHPRDIIDLLLDMTRFYDEEPKLASEWIDLACTSYFVDAEEAN